jgi:hypothetical protein
MLEVIFLLPMARINSLELLTCQVLVSEMSERTFSRIMGWKWFYKHLVYTYSWVLPSSTMTPLRKIISLQRTLCLQPTSCQDHLDDDQESIFYPYLMISV